jgi:hypothetical protein
MPTAHPFVGGSESDSVVVIMNFARATNFAVTPQPRLRSLVGQWLKAVTLAMAVSALCLLLILAVSGGERYCVFWPSIDTRYAAGYSERGFERVQVGMSEDEVVALIGRPLETHAFWKHPAYKQWGQMVWSYTQDGAAPWGDWAWLSREVIFRNGRVAQKVRWIYYD